MLRLVDELEETNEEDTQKSVNLLRKDGERQLHIKDKVRILFSSGAIQVWQFFIIKFSGSCLIRECLINSV